MRNLKPTEAALLPQTPESNSAKAAQHTLNRLRLQARLIEAQAPRFTPAGIDVIDLILQHTSDQSQSADAKPRRVSLTLKAVAFSDTARFLSRSTLGSELDVEGFLVNGSGKQSKQVLLQIERCQLVKPDQRPAI